jgi:uncharacterized protein
MTPLDVSVPFGFGVVSSLHCSQMCGPIVLSYSLAGRTGVPAHLLYNLGRLITYSTLGAAAGAAGNAMGLLGRIAGYESTASVVAGVLLIVAGLLMCGLLPNSGLVTIRRFPLTRVFSGFIGRLLMSPRPASRLALGMMMGFLPCGLLYAALLKAVSTGEAVAGALTMASFAAGTSLALLTIGLFSTAIGARLGRWTSAFATAGVFLMGGFLLWRGLMPPPSAGPSCHGHS